MTDLLTFMALALVCLTLAQLNIVLFGIIGRALRDKAILGDKEIIVIPSEDETTTEEGAAEETEEATEETEETETKSDGEQLTVLAAKIADLAVEVSTLAATRQ